MKSGISRRGGARVLGTGREQINILAISTSPIRLSVVVDGAQTAAAVLHRKGVRPRLRRRVRETQLSAEEIAAR